MAVILAYSKITLYEELLASNVPEDPYFHKDLLNYFPRPLRQRFAKEMDTHPLRREIIATYTTNSTLNRMGSTLVFRMREETGEDAPATARAYTAAREMFEARRLWSAIEALDNQVPAKVQIDMHIEGRRLLERASLWLLRNRRPPLNIETVVNQFAGGITTLTAGLPELLPEAESAALQQTYRQLIDAGVPEDLAQWIASLDNLYSALDLIEVADQTGLPVEAVAIVYFGLVSRLELNWLRESITNLPVANHWQHRARSALLNGLYDQQRALTADVLQLTSSQKPPEQRLETWLEHNRSGVARSLGMFADLRASGQPDLAMLSVALRETANLVHGGGDREAPPQEASVSAERRVESREVVHG
jgi:glutamate dehydrogenase